MNWLEPGQLQHTAALSAEAPPCPACEGTAGSSAASLGRPDIISGPWPRTVLMQEDRAVPEIDGLPAESPPRAVLLLSYFPRPRVKCFDTVYSECGADGGIGLDLIKNLKNESFHTAVMDSRVMSAGCSVVSSCF